MEGRKRKREVRPNERRVSRFSHTVRVLPLEPRHEVGEKHGEKGWRGEGERGREKGQEKDRQPFESPR